MKHKDTFKQDVQDTSYWKASLNELNQQTKNHVAS